MTPEQMVQAVKEGVRTVTSRDITGCACCGVKDGQPLVMNSKCHEGMPTMATLCGSVLFITCSICENPVAAFKVDLREQA